MSIKFASDLTKSLNGPLTDSAYNFLNLFRNLFRVGNLCDGLTN